MFCGARLTIGFGACLPVFFPLMQVGERFTRLLHEQLGHDLKGYDTVDAEHAEVFEHLAPAGNGPDPDPIFHLQRAHDAH